MSIFPEDHLGQSSEAAVFFFPWIPWVSWNPKLGTTIGINGDFWDDYWLIIGLLLVGFWVDYWDDYWFIALCALCETKITMEDHHVEWLNQRTKWPMLVCQKVSLDHPDSMHNLQKSTGSQSSRILLAAVLVQPSRFNM